MKKSFKTLIKLQKTLVDEQQRQLAQLRDHLALIETKIAQLQVLQVREKKAAEQDPVTRMTYGAFLKTVITLNRELEKQRRSLEGEVVRAQAKLAELFEEQKRYEIAEEQRLEEIVREVKRLETLQLDEVGGVMHERKRIND
ncbi:MAG: hypothetical protein PHE27_02690 [Alphaproteobacteria bacterium]|nr:hypothetical protein [Alphaproteobacteria bacterium]